MKRIPPLRNDDAKKRKAEVSVRLDERARAHVKATVLAEYRRLDREPVYAGDMIITPELVDMLRMPR